DPLLLFVTALERAKLDEDLYKRIMTVVAPGQIGAPQPQVPPTQDAKIDAEKEAAEVEITKIDAQAVIRSAREPLRINIGSGHSQFIGLLDLTSTL
ncbi:hypothetical protein BGX27_003951, partial [Mortierella sp. AM989]